MNAACSSASALLNALDACSAGAVVRLGVERAYMSQLLRVQRARGAQGGHAFAAALRLSRPVYPPGDISEIHSYIRYKHTLTFKAPSTQGRDYRNLSLVTNMMLPQMTLCSLRRLSLKRNTTLGVCLASPPSWTREWWALSSTPPSTAPAPLKGIWIQHSHSLMG